MYFNVSEECLAKGCTNMACEHMKGVTMAHDVTKQVTIEKTNVNGAVTATTTTVNGKVETQVFEGC
jgi:K(+)-stimulated pyrophosphate-energized sodium pump